MSEDAEATEEPTVQTDSEEKSMERAVERPASERGFSLRWHWAFSESRQGQHVPTRYAH